MTFREATQNDTRTLFEWRNDPETRAHSLSTDPVSWRGHCEWLERSLGDPNRKLYIAVDDKGNDVGTVRFERIPEGSLELSWTVAPVWRGKGIGKEMVTAALALPLVASKGVKAQIKSDNIASQRIAQAAGFYLQREHEGLGEWQFAPKTMEEKK